MLKCFKCGKKAVGRLSPDMDLEGFGFCKEHKFEITANYMMLFSEDKKIQKCGEEFFKNKK